ncbi:MAG: PrsW family intramembrane metalloprotease [Thermoplasmatota archaeon]
MDAALFAGLVALSLLPPFLFALNVRSQERHDREPVRAVVGTFLWGGTIGVIVALILHAFFAFGYQQSGAGLVLSTEMAAVLIAAPVVEELAKGFGLRLPRRNIWELEDGIVYGAAIGLGFAATENLVYGIVALAEGGFSLAFGTVALRVISAMLLHASASAIVGYGYSRARLGAGGLGIVAAYLLAVLLHAAYNFLVSLEVFYGVLMGIVLVATTMAAMRKTLTRLDRETW